MNVLWVRLLHINKLAELTIFIDGIKAWWSAHKATKKHTDPSQKRKYTKEPNLNVHTQKPRERREKNKLQKQTQTGLNSYTLKLSTSEKFIHNASIKKGDGKSERQSEREMYGAGFG